MEDAGIAWPNPAMWCQIPQRIYSISPPHKTKAKTRDPDANGHSPVHRAVMKDGTCAPSDKAKPASTSPHELVDPPAQGTRELQHELEDPCWARMPLLPDPFVDDSRYRLRKRLTEGSASDHQPVSDSHPTLSAREDDPNQITTNAAARDILPLPESQFDELMASYSPHKDTSCGAFTSANLKVACAVNTPPIQKRFTVGSELKIQSCFDEDLSSTAPTTRDSELAEVQMDPGSGKRSIASNRSFGQSELPGTTTRTSTAKDIKSKESILKSDHKIRKQPATDLSRNHGKGIEMRDGEDPIAIGDSTRKRANPNSKHRQVNINSDSNCSPTRKSSRVGWNRGCAGEVMRVRLGSLDNIGRW